MMLITPAAALNPNSAVLGPFDGLDLADFGELDGDRAPFRHPQSSR